MEKSNHTETVTKLTDVFEENVFLINKYFLGNKNADFVMEHIYIPFLDRDAVLFYIRGMANEQQIFEKVIPAFNRAVTYTLYSHTTLGKLKELAPVTIRKELHSFQEMEICLNGGQSLLLIEGEPVIYPIDTKSIESRSVGNAEIETVLKGPKEAFVESEIINTSLIRKQLRTSQLVKEHVKVGYGQENTVALLYLNDVANEELVEKVRERIAQIEVENVQNLPMLEQHIEERPYSLVPSILTTERPDRAAAFLKEGHVVLLMDSSPDCLVMPVTFWSFFHTAEDYYQRWAYGNLMRIVRLLAFFAALLAPATFIAVTNYHVEALPTDMLLTVSATRDLVPFPAIFEIILVEITFDIIREAGTRFPSKNGPIVALLGALIISIAAIEAGIISPIVVTVVGFSSLASYTIATNSFVFAVRIARFAFIALASFIGFFGIAIGVQACVAYLASLKSFDVPFVSPMAPHYPSSKDLIVRPPLWKMWLRPLHVYPLKEVRGKKPEGGGVND
ncbi:MULTISPECIES: spore germination protein [Bacillus]|uniref:spore germination protein n=1 Tax=Bacillus TaxID=1386 RepID=UPI000BB8F23D|nr:MULTISPECIES: spore germination protein [Bacillus]